MLIDVIIVLILIYCVLSGYRKGLLMSLMGLIVLVVSCLGASLSQNALTDRAVSYLEPRIMEIIEPRLEAQLGEDTQAALDSAGEVSLTLGGASITMEDLLELMRSLGLDVEQTAPSAVTEALEPAVDAAARTISHALTKQLAGAAIFGASFLILYLLLQSVMLGLNLVDRLPVIHGFNHAGGGILGLLTALVLLVAAAAVCQRAELLPGDKGPVLTALLELTNRVLPL